MSASHLLGCRHSKVDVIPGYDGRELDDEIEIIDEEIRGSERGRRVCPRKCHLFRAVSGSQDQGSGISGDIMQHHD